MFRCNVHDHHLPCPECDHLIMVAGSSKRRTRPSIDTYLMHLAVVAATRGTCDRRRVGCVLSVHGHVASMGYNGSAPRSPHCDDAGHMMHDGHCVRTIHAEANAIAHAARMGVSLDGAYAYCTTRPCPTCLLLLASAGVRVVYHLEPYHPEEDTVSEALLTDMNLVVREYIGERPWER